MLSWLQANALTIGILLFLGAAVAAIIVFQIRGRRKGRTSCGCGCAHCPMAGKCHPHTEVQK